MEMEEEQIFGIPEEGETRIEASVSHDTDRYDEKQESMGQSKPEKPRRSMKSGTKAKAKAKEKAKNKLTPLLNALGIEITETMDLLCLAASPDPRMTVLCRKVGATLLKMEDIRCQITAEMER